MCPCFATVYGDVVTRSRSTRLREGHAIHQVDNPNLQAIFFWLQRNHVASIDDLHGFVDDAMFRQTVVDTSVEWGVDIPRAVITFSGLRTSNFSVAIPRFFELLKQVEYRHVNVTYQALLREVEMLELELSRFKETLKERV